MKKNLFSAAWLLGVAVMSSVALTADPIAPAEIEGEAVYVPYPVQLKLDGKLEDWAGVPMQVVARGTSLSQDPAENGSFQFATAASSTHFFIQMQMKDKVIVAGKHGGDYWNEDSMEFYLNTTKDLEARSYVPGIVQVSVSPVDIGNTDPKSLKHFGQNYQNLDLQGFVFKTVDGWGVEASIPLSKLGLTPKHGLEIGFQAHGNGAAQTDRNVKLIWSKSDRSDSSYQNPSLFGRALFFELGRKDIPIPTARASSTPATGSSTVATTVPAPTAPTTSNTGSTPVVNINPSIGAVQSGQYRNLFAELGIAPNEIEQRIETIWKQLFESTDDQQRLYYPVGNDEAYIYAADSNDVRSEGQSYGMMIAVQLDKKQHFDRIWKWTKRNMQYRDGEAKGYFCWSVRPNGNKNCDNNASDGEAWIITALFMAAERWGNGQGIYNYQAEAQAILDAARSKDAQKTATKDLFNRQNKLITFVAKGNDALFTDPSYMVPAFLELWAQKANKDQTFWKEAADAARAFWKKAAHPTTGLMSDYAHFDGTPKGPSFNTGAVDYRYDARRVHMNIALDWAWFRKDTWQPMQQTKVLDFFHAKGVRTHGASYTLAGQQIAPYNEEGHTAMLALIALSVPSSNAKAWDFVRYLWERRIPTGTYRYYNGLLYMLGMLNASGKFKYNHKLPTPTKTVALIFDDGPSAAATQFLEILKKEKIVATFAAIGKNVVQFPEIAKQVVAAGHELVNHSYNHQAHAGLSDEKIVEEMQSTQDAIFKATGYKPKWYWSPYLESNARINTAAQKVGITPYPLGRVVVSQDYDNTVEASKIYYRATSNVPDRSVINFHEWRTETLLNLSAIIQSLKQQGYAFTTLSGLQAK